MLIDGGGVVCMIGPVAHVASDPFPFLERFLLWSRKS